MKNLLLAGLLLTLLAATADARWSAQYADSSPEIQAWFKSQHNSTGQWCCDESDGHPWYDGYEFNEKGDVLLRYQGKNRVIPSAQVLTGHNPTGHAIWWFTEHDGDHRDYCFSPGSLG